MLRRWQVIVALVAVLGVVAGAGRADDEKKKNDKKKVEPGVALITLKGELSDGPSATPNPFTGSGADTLRTMQERINKAAKDDAVKALVLYMEGFSASWTDRNELRQTLANFRKSGKKVHCYLESATMGGYVVAAACDDIILPPVGGLELPGIRFEMPFFKDVMDKLGLKGDVVPLGEFKAAGESFSRSKMSEANRKQWEKMADDYYEILAESIATSRKGFDAAKAKAAIDTAVFTPKAAIEAGLADTIGYFDDSLAEIKKSLGNEKLATMKDYGKSKEELDLSNPFALFKLLVPAKEAKLNDKPKVALIYCLGSITTGKSSVGLTGQSMGSTTVVEMIQKAAKEPSVKVIVLRVDSPGGSALASDLIWKATQECKKPVVVSMGDVAGSGGYYISCGADRIFAEPGTITGSIGVISMKIVYGGLFEKLGVNTELVSRGKHSDFMSSTREFTAEEREIMLRMMGDVYDTFLSRVIHGRKKAGKTFEVGELKKIAGGRIWTGRTAKELGLVDEVGTLDDAIAYAKEKAGLENAKDVEIWTQPKDKGSILDSLLDVEVATRLRALTGLAPGLQKQLQALEVVGNHPRERLWLFTPYAVQSK